MIQKLLWLKGRISVLFKNIFWLIVYGRYFRKMLSEKYNIVNLRLFKFCQWHLGCKYFIGYQKERNKCVFIKTCSNDGRIEREIDVFNYLMNSDDSAYKYLPDLICFEKDDKTPFLAVEFIVGVALDEYLSKNSNIDKREKIILDIINQLIDLALLLNESKIIHRDIRPANIMLRKNVCQVVLIDFAFAIRAGDDMFSELSFVTKAPEVLDKLGEEYKPEQYVWDDAYAINLIIERLIDRYHIKYPKSMSELKNIVGRVTYKHEIFDDKKLPV